MPFESEMTTRNIGNDHDNGIKSYCKRLFKGILLMRQPYKSLSFGLWTLCSSMHKPIPHYYSCWSDEATIIFFYTYTIRQRSTVTLYFNNDHCAMGTCTRCMLTIWNDLLKEIDYGMPLTLLLQDNIICALVCDIKHVI